MGGKSDKSDKKPVKSAAAVEQDGDKPRAAAGVSSTTGHTTASAGVWQLTGARTSWSKTPHSALPRARESRSCASCPNRHPAASTGDTTEAAVPGGGRDPGRHAEPRRPGWPRRGPAASLRDTTFSELCSDFCWNVLTQLCEEWRMRRDAVLRWVRGWYAEHGIADLPQAAVQPPSACPLATAPRPGRLTGPGGRAAWPTADARLTPSALAIGVGLSPRARRARAAPSWSRAMTVGRPPTLPCARAAFRPAIVGSWMMSRSSSAKTATYLTERPRRSSFRTTRMSPGRR